MTKYGLGEEAEEYAIKNLGMTLSIKGHIEHAYLAGAKAREKKIAELEEENAELKKQCKVGKCKNHFVAVDIQTNASVICYKAYNCNECTQYNEG